jgi:hypothetical protein
MVHEATAGYIGNMELYTAEARSWKKPYFPSWNLTSTYGTMSTKITIIRMLKLQKKAAPKEDKSLRNNQRKSHCLTLKS